MAKLAIDVRFLCITCLVWDFIVIWDVKKKYCMLCMELNGQNKFITRTTRRYKPNVEENSHKRKIMNSILTLRPIHA